MKYFIIFILFTFGNYIGKTYIMHFFDITKVTITELRQKETEREGVRIKVRNVS